jgi:glycosyltransferase involved in cell wall biosynthesis
MSKEGYVPCATQPKYVVISPVRDEGHLIEKTILSIASQTVRPIQWVPVDDGSKDNTGAVIDEYARKYPWIIAVHRSDHGFREPGTGMINAFYDGYQFLQQSGWDFIVKLDGDLDLTPDYFEKCFTEFSSRECWQMIRGLIRAPGCGTRSPNSKPTRWAGPRTVY